MTTVTGEVRTVVVTPSPTATSDANLGQPSAGGGGSNVGKVVGIVLGVVLGVIAVIALAIWLWLRRRRQNNSDSPRPESTFMARTGDSASSNNVPSRQVSQMSSAGLLGNKAPRINTSGMPAGSDPRSADTTSSNFDRRSVGTDQRLNPYALYIHDEGRVSDVSLQDNQDYSRQLRVSDSFLETCMKQKLTTIGCQPRCMRLCTTVHVESSTINANDEDRRLNGLHSCDGSQSPQDRGVTTSP